MKMVDVKPLVELQTEIEKAEKNLVDVLPTYQKCCEEYGAAKKHVSDLYQKREVLIKSMFTNYFS